MIRRVSRAMSLDLVKQVAKVEITACIHNPESRSVFELYRQMRSTKFNEANPKYQCVLNHVEDEKIAPKLSVEFSNKMKWDVNTAGFSAARLREGIFSRAHDVEILDSIANSDKPEDL